MQILQTENNTFFFEYKLRECDKRSKHSPFGDHFLNFLQLLLLIVWLILIENRGKNRRADIRVLIP